MIQRNGFIEFKKFVFEKLKLDVNNYLTISSLAYDHLKRNCLCKIDNLYEVGGHLKKFMENAVHGGRCMSAHNRKWNTKIKLDCFDACGLYTSAMARPEFGIATGVPIIMKNENLNYEWLENNVADYIVEVEIT